MTEAEKISEAVKMAVRYGQVDGTHHKAWVIDQMVRILCGNDYEQTIRDSYDSEYGSETYGWDEGIAP